MDTVSATSTTAHGLVNSGNTLCMHKAMVNFDEHGHGFLHNGTLKIQSRCDSGAADTAQHCTHNADETKRGKFYASI